MKMNNIWSIKKPMDKKNKKKSVAPIFNSLKAKSLANKKFDGARYSNPLLKPISKTKKKSKVSDIFKIKSPMKDKNMNWAQSKWKYPKLKPMGDKDKDGVKNMFDCKPLDKKRQDFIYGWQTAVNKKIIPAEKGMSVRYGGRGSGHSGTGLYGYSTKEKALKEKSVYEDERSLYKIEIKKPFKPNSDEAERRFSPGWNNADFHATLRDIKNEDLDNEVVEKIKEKLDAYGLKKTSEQIRNAREISDKKEINPANIIIGEEGYDGVIYEEGDLMDSHYGGSVKFEEKDIDESEVEKIEERPTTIQNLEEENTIENTSRLDDEVHPNEVEDKSIEEYQAEDKAREKVENKEAGEWIEKENMKKQVESLNEIEVEEQVEREDEE